MKRLDNRGTAEAPWIIFSSDTTTGVSILDGRPLWILDGASCDISDWLNGVQKKGHIDRMTKYAILAAIATGDGVIGAIAKRFFGG